MTQGPLEIEPETFDLLVVGGGINGAGAARDAAGRGLRALLVEKDDLAEGTSSRSGKYIHGGLRYLEQCEFGLVRKALIEREVILAAAPHLAWPLRLVLIHSPEQRPRWLIRLGLALYDRLGGRKRIPATAAVNLETEPEGEPVAPEFRRGFAYWDVWVDDSRLVILNAVDAARRGASVRTRTEMTSAWRENGIWRAALRDRRRGSTHVVGAKAIFNAAGPWVESVLGSVKDARTERRMRLVKGSHVILRRWWEGAHGYVLQSTDRRILFVNPYRDNLALVGTTDVPYEGRPEDAECDEEEVRYLVAQLNRYFRRSFAPGDVLWSYAGVRPLFDDGTGKSASAVTRDYMFDLGPARPDGRTAPLLSAFGGKLTTYRKLAEEGLERLRPFLPGMGPKWTKTAPLPGGDLPGADFGGWQAGLRKRHPECDDALLTHYARCYGADAERLLEGVRSTADLGRHFGGRLYQREVEHLRRDEWAVTAEDIVERRTKHCLELSEREREVLERWLADNEADA